MNLPLVDSFQRPLKSLRLSVTDRCNLRCRYCMPEEHYQWLRRNLILSFEELTRLVGSFVNLGVDRLRLTGGEPLLRKDLPELVAQLSQLGLNEIALTTNGVLLSKWQEQLFQAGVDRFTVSIDALEPELFRDMCQREDLHRVLQGLESVACSPGLKIDSVIIKGTNEHQMLPLLSKGLEVGAEVRFIEYMDVGGATQWSSEKVFSQDEMLRALTREFGDIRTLPDRGSAPASRFELPNGQVFGIIASTTKPFCSDCDRARVTADGQLLTCLYSRVGMDLRKLLRTGISDDELHRVLAQHWGLRKDRGAENRLRLEQRGPLAKAEELQENVHLEMHTRGG